MKRPYQELDRLVKTQLGHWPQRPPGLESSGAHEQGWVRGRPAFGLGSYGPFLKLPGSQRLRTLPDGLWLRFGGTPVEIFVDIFVVEACGTLANLLDKRSRFAPSTQSLMAVCPVPWLLAAISEVDATARWRFIPVLREQPSAQLIVPVRDVKVLYALKRRHYHGFTTSQVPHPHEYFLPMESLIAEGSADDPALRALVARTSATGNFLRVPAGTTSG